jgi:aromatic ring-cleaving dioxygenase
MTEPAEPSEAVPPATAYSSMDAAGLLVHALGQLPSADRDKVYIWLLGTSLQLQGGLVGPLGGQLTRAMRADVPASRQQDFAEAEAEVLRGLFRSTGSPAQQMVPVRFSAEQHARLRAWCTEHGFSMATVIRGLVDRFLDGQQAAPG